MNVAITPRPKLQPRESHTPRLVNLLHSPKRIRVTFNGETIADSRNVLVLRSNQFLPVYYFPRAAVTEQHLVPSEHRSQHELGGKAQYWTLKVGNRRAENAAWSFPAPIDPTLAPLAGYIAFVWNAADHWYEEDEEVFVHARDPYARVDTLHSTSHVQVWLDGELIADSRKPVLVFETHLPTRFYIPHEDVRLDRLVPSDSQTRCPYKGLASYWSARLKDGTIRKDVAWEYGNPIPEIPKIKGLIAFYPDAVDEIRLDGERVA
ncbi:hypothetical protein GCM10007874_52410 [Labrys miyagiensis]|uniref:DUF427 domain-containing protein n=1 Tax=Labrys miyagiensis TaxID=346912 RepID=A0ABQ6CPY8_9HYPH|nr:DUF427 domain-containing protein [Labrys miyagiensis]GLS22224.1 hypothetical protein GCM10007874_52410 [Labrys miyagiensis]